MCSHVMENSGYFVKAQRKGTLPGMRPTQIRSIRGLESHKQTTAVRVQSASSVSDGRVWKVRRRKDGHLCLLFIRVK